jgi:hypothetical protein
VLCLGNKLTNSDPGARSRESDRCACQNRRWFLRSPRGSYYGCCQRVRFPSTYEGVAPVPMFLCGTPGMRWKGAFPRRILSRRGGNRSDPRLHVGIYSYYFWDTLLAVAEKVSYGASRANIFFPGTASAERSARKICDFSAERSAWRSEKISGAVKGTVFQQPARVMSQKSIESLFAL